MASPETVDVIWHEQTSWSILNTQSVQHGYDEDVINIGDMPTINTTLNYEWWYSVQGQLSPILSPKFNNMALLVINLLQNTRLAFTS